MPPTCYRGCWHVVSRGLFSRYRPFSSLEKGVYDPKAFIPHAVSLGQAFAHCPKFFAAASRRSGNRVSVSLWLTIFSDQLSVFGLVSRYLTNYLIEREPLLEPRKRVSSPRQGTGIVCGISLDLSRLYPTQGQVTHALLSRSPLSTRANPGFSLDLHALDAPPAFTLSQDQTLWRITLLPSTIQLLRCKSFMQPPRGRLDTIIHKRIYACQPGVGLRTSS